MESVEDFVRKMVNEQINEKATLDYKVEDYNLKEDKYEFFKDVGFTSIFWLHFLRNLFTRSPRHYFRSMSNTVFLLILNGNDDILESGFVSKQCY